MTHPSHHHLHKRRWRLAGWVILWLWHHETIHTGNLHRNDYLMLHHIAAATIQVANLVNYNCYPLDDDNRALVGSPDFGAEIRPPSQWQKVCFSQFQTKNSQFDKYFFFWGGGGVAIFISYNTNTELVVTYFQFHRVIEYNNTCFFLSLFS